MEIERSVTENIYYPVCRIKMKKERIKKNKKFLWLVLFFFVILGTVGGVSIKYVFFEHIGRGAMTNAEANRLISYLGIHDYEYSDRLGSSFLAGSAKKLIKKSGVSYDKIDVQIKNMPNFVPLTKKQFESIYSSLIVELELDRLSSENLYIFNIDTANVQEIDGIVYEIVYTNAGDYYMEKDYGMDISYIGKIVQVYVSNNEIILCQGESEENVQIRNSYVSKITKNESEEDVLLVHVNGESYQIPIADKAKKSIPKEGFLCDLSVSNKGVMEIKDYSKGLMQAKVTSYKDGVLYLDGSEEPLYLSDYFNVYKVKGVFKSTTSAGTLIGYENVSLLLKDGMVEAALITEDIHSKNIRVLLNNSDYTNYFHDEVTITSDTPFTVTYGEKVDRYEAKEKIQFRNGSEELKNNVAVVKSEAEDGKLTISSLNRQSGAPSYRGNLEISRDDKGVMVINELPVEEYLYGVLPSEMPVSYEMEALKAQAICARSYAYRQMESEKYVEYGAHLDDSVSSQVYNNVPEDKKAIFAVDDTYGVVPCYQNEVIEAFFFSTSCGTTSNNQSVWGGYPKPYLLDLEQTELNDLANFSDENAFRSFINGELGTGFVEEKEPFFRWTVEFSKEQMTETINSTLYNRIQAMPEYLLVKDASNSYSKKDIATIGEVERIEITKRGDSGIIEEMVITGTQETILVKGQTNARALLSPLDTVIQKQDGSTVSNWNTLPSAYYYVDFIANTDTENTESEDGNEAAQSDGVDGVFVIRGGGFGHGVGMSQNGANNMAKLGYSASDIISHYYTGIELKDMYEMMGK